MEYAGIIIEDIRGRYLLQLRDNKTGIINPDRWGTFGGGIRKNESPTNGAIRELKEELGLRLVPEDIKLFLKFLLPRHKIYLYKLDLKQDIKRSWLKEGKDMKYYTRREILRKKNLVRSLRFIFWIYPFISGIQSVKNRLKHTGKQS